MKKRWKWKLIAFFAVIASLLLLGGCKFQYSLDEKREEYGLTASVTYHTNGKGAYFGTDSTVKTLYFKDGSVAINIGVDRVTVGAIPTPTRVNHTLLGWHEAELDIEGNVQLDENGEVVLKEDAFDFKTRLKEGDEIVLYANWKKNAAVNVYLVCTEITQDAPFTLEDGTVVNNGELLKSYDYQSNNKRPMPKNAPSATGYTPLEYYTDEACTQVVQWPIDSEVAGDCKIYLKYIKGDWTILKTADNVKGMFAATATRNYYLANNINCAGVTVNRINNFTSNLQGNGYTIKNLTVNGGTLQISGATISAFGNIKGNAKMEKVTFENMTLNCTLASNVMAQAFIFCSTIESTATISGVTLKGEITMNVSREKSALLTNMEKNNAWYYEHVLFGDCETDQENLDNGLSVTIDGDATVAVKMDKDEIELS